MVIGIVGSEGKKFTPDTEDEARRLIRQLMVGYDKVVSGGCHLGGIDIWAIEIAKEYNKRFQEFLPRTKSWPDYKQRNILIADASDVVVCITVKTLPPGYKEQGFERFCYHCNTNEHIKSGGCWTVKYAKKLGKLAHVIVIGDKPNDSQSKEV